MSSKRGRPTLAPEEDARRLELWRQGLTDPEIGARCCVAHQTIAFWRQARGLPARGRRGRAGAGGVPMRTVLPPEGCEVILRFLAALAALQERYPERRIDVTAAMTAWRNGLLQRGESA